METLSINGTLIWYYYICKREVWLIGHSIEANQDNEFLALGRHIHELFYQRNKKEILIDNKIKIDILPLKKVIGEIKKSSKFIKSARMQLAFYLFYLKQKGVEIEGEILIPKERKREKIILDEKLEIQLKKAISEIEEIINLPKPPPAKKNQYCKTCAYKEMCWS